CAPFLSQHRPGLAGAELAAWQLVFERGRLAWFLGENADARRDLQEAWRLDPQYADTAYMLGSIDLQARDNDGARRYLLEAGHWDALRFRPDPALSDIIREVAARNPEKVGLLDTAKLFGSDPGSTSPPTGRELLLEHVHPSFEGNNHLAFLLAGAAEFDLFGQ